MSNKFYDGYYKYDKQVSETYDQTRQGEAHWAFEDAFVEQYLKNRTIRRLLDIPAGTGRFFHLYQSVGEVVGIDISGEMLAQASQKLSYLPGKASVLLSQGDIFNLAFAEATFDVIIIFRLFHLMPETLLNQAIREVCRVGCQDILVQTYVPLVTTQVGSKAILRKLGRKFKERLQAKNPFSHKPWSHIKAYYHSQALVNAKFASYGFNCKNSIPLDKYESTEVRGTIYSKSG